MGATESDGGLTIDGKRLPYVIAYVEQQKEHHATGTLIPVLERTEDSYVAYPIGLKGVVVGEGETYEAALADVKSAIDFHIETFGEEVFGEHHTIKAIRASASADTITSSCTPCRRKLSTSSATSGPAPSRSRSARNPCPM